MLGKADFDLSQSSDPFVGLCLLAALTVKQIKADVCSDRRKVQLRDNP